MNRVTLCLAYYENPGMLRRQLDQLAALPADLSQVIDLIVVDDGSPNSPALDVFENYLGPTHPIAREVQLYRMAVDIPWNQDACRNLAVAQAETPWVLLTDIDHLVPLATWRRVIEQKLADKAVYKFGRVSEPDLSPYKTHPNSWLMTRAMYDRCGGYDERFRGWYGTDGDFRNRVQKVAKVEILPEVLVRVPREVTPDASTTTLTRKGQINEENIARIKRERSASQDPRPLHNLTPWARVI